MLPRGHSRAHSLVTLDSTQRRTCCTLFVTQGWPPRGPKAHCLARRARVKSAHVGRWRIAQERVEESLQLCVRAVRTLASGPVHAMLQPSHAGCTKELWLICPTPLQNARLTKTPPETICDVSLGHWTSTRSRCLTNCLSPQLRLDPCLARRPCLCCHYMLIVAASPCMHQAGSAHQWRR